MSLPPRLCSPGASARPPQARPSVSEQNDRHVPSRQAAPRPLHGLHPLEQAAPGVHTALPPVPSLHRVTSPVRPSRSEPPSTVSRLLSSQCPALAWGQQRHLLLWKPPVLELTVGHLGRWCGPPVYMALATQLPYLTCGTHLWMGLESPSPWAGTGPQGTWTPRPGAAKTLVLLTSCACQARDSAQHS